MRTLILLLAASLLATPVVADDAEVEAVDGCSEKTIATGTSPQHSVTTHKDCTATVELNKGIICVGPWTATDVYQVGPVQVIHHRCAFPGGDPGELVSLEASAGPCGQTHLDGPISVALRTDCSVLVSIRLYECVWGGYWHQHTPSPLEVREYRCGSPVE